MKKTIAVWALVMALINCVSAGRLRIVVALYWAVVAVYWFTAWKEMK